MKRNNSASLVVFQEDLKSENKTSFEHETKRIDTWKTTTKEYKIFIKNKFSKWYKVNK